MSRFVSCAAPRAPSLRQLMRAAACMLLGQALLMPIAVQAQAQVGRRSGEEEELALSFGDKATVSIATGTQQPLRRAPAVATVITAQDIKAMGADWTAVNATAIFQAGARSVDAMIDQIKVETDTAKRDALIRDAYKILNDEVAYLPIHHQIRPWAMKKNVSIAHNSNDAPKMYYANIK